MYPDISKNITLTQKNNYIFLVSHSVFFVKIKRTKVEFVHASFMYKCVTEPLIEILSMHLRCFLHAAFAMFTPRIKTLSAWHGSADFKSFLFTLCLSRRSSGAHLAYTNILSSTWLPTDTYWTAPKQVVGAGERILRQHQTNKSSCMCGVYQQTLSFN